MQTQRAFPWATFHHHGGQEVTRHCEPQLSRAGMPEVTAVPTPFPGTGLEGTQPEAWLNPLWLLGPGSDPNGFSRTKKGGRPLSPAVEDCHGHGYRSGQGQGEPVTAETLALSIAKAQTPTRPATHPPYWKGDLGGAIWLPTIPPRPEGPGRTVLGAAKSNRTSWKWRTFPRSIQFRHAWRALGRSPTLPEEAEATALGFVGVTMVARVTLGQAGQDSLKPTLALTDGDQGGGSEATELCPDRPHPAATGASRPSGGFPRRNLSPARADWQRRSGAAPTSPGPAHTHRLASLSGVSREPVLARGPLQKTKEGSVIS